VESADVPSKPFAIEDTAVYRNGKVQEQARNFFLGFMRALSSRGNAAGVA
jgi:hypothetical protein